MIHEMRVLLNRQACKKEDKVIILDEPLVEEQNDYFNLSKNSHIYKRSRRYALLFTFLIDTFIGMWRSISYILESSFDEIISMVLAILITYLIYFILLVIVLFTYRLLYYIYKHIKEEYFNKDSFLTLFFKAQAIEFAEKRKEYEQKVQEYNKTSEEKIKAKKAEYAKKIEEANK